MKSSTAILMLICLISCQKKNQEKSPNSSQSVNREKPIMGWASWNNYRVNINEDIIKSQVDALVSKGLKEVGYSFINIDDGFFGGRDEKGRLLAHKKRFPSGMKLLSDYIHSKGLKAGIYSDAGINTCASYWDKDTIGVGMGLYGHEKEDLNLFLKEWDYDFIKIDWCGGKWLNLDEKTRYTRIGELIRSIKPETIFNVCRWKFPGKWVTRIANSWRISGDIHNRFESIVHIVDLNADLWKYCSKGHFNDMDMLQVGRGMSYEEDKTHFTMWCMMHSPLLLGNDLTTITDETLEIITNKEIIALNQSDFIYQARKIKDLGEIEIWAKPLISTISGEVAVALLNRSSQDCTIEFQPSIVGIDISKGYSMRDLWKKKDFNISTDSILNFSVPSHGVVALKIKGKSFPYNVFQYDMHN